MVCEQTDLLKDYGQYWFVSITPYGRDIEPNVPDKHRLIEDFKRLSDMVGIDSTGWRFDPIFLSERYTMEYQLRAFDKIASALDGYTQTAVISFIDLYPKVRRNFQEAREVTREQRLALGKEIIKIASAHGMIVKPCAEGDELAAYGKRKAQERIAPAICPAISARIIPANIYAGIATQILSPKRFWRRACSMTLSRRF